MGKISQVIPVFLLNALWQAALIYAVAAICARLMRRAPARQQHLLWAAALALSTAVPLWSILHLWQGSLSASPPSPAAAAHSGGEPAEVLQGLSVMKGLWKVALLQNRGGTVNYPTFIAVSLSLCYAAFLLRRSVKLWRAWAESVAVRGRVLELSQHGVLDATVKRCRAGLGLNDVPVLCSTEVAAPLTAGALRPVILLPARLYTSETSPEVLASVVGHEMAHVRRRDFAVNLALELLQLPVSFHPAVCLMRRRVRETREIACDELVASRLVEPGTYARALVKLAGEMSRPAHTANTLGVFDADILEERVMRLVDKKARAGSFARRALALASAVALGVTCAAASAYSFGAGQEPKDAARTFPRSTLLGTWHGTMKGLPAATLTLKEVGGKLSGTAVFYAILDRGNGPESGGPSPEMPLSEMKYDGRTLSFSIAGKHPETGKEETVRGELRLTGEDEAVLQAPGGGAKTEQAGADEGRFPPIKMKKKQNASQ